jgi:CRISPR system Cascade subunit CasC
MLVEVHVLQNHSPSNLNRDDTGSPKEAIFGGYKRARISSQCLKRSIRRSEIFRDQLQGSLATRTRSLPQLIRQRMLSEDFDSEMAEIGAKKASAFGTDEGKERDPNHSGHYRTAQTMFLSDDDIKAVYEVIRDAAVSSKDEKAFSKVSAKELQKKAEDKGLRTISVDVALFGRMVTSEAFVNVEAASQFAHAISTHKIDHEFDYFTAVDDLLREEDDEAGSGADMIGDIEYNSACYYKYFNVHVNGLIDNITGKALNRSAVQKDDKTAREVASKAVSALINATCRITPSGKQNSFAAHQPPSLVWVEIRDKNLPVSYANAFCKPVYPRSKNGLEKESALSLKDECEKLTNLYDLEAKERLLLSKDPDFEILEVCTSPSLKEMLDSIEAAIMNG